MSEVTQLKESLEKKEAQRQSLDGQIQRLQNAIDALRTSATRGRLENYRRVTDEECKPVLECLEGAGIEGELRRDIENVTEINSGRMSHVLAHLVRLKKIVQTNPPKERNTKWRLAGV